MSNCAMNLSLLAALLVLLTSTCYADSKGYQIEERWYSQPVDHERTDSEQFKQQYFVLTPDQLLGNHSVIFILGNEMDTTVGMLEGVYEKYGSPKDKVFIYSEHRGYGQSLTHEDQTKPEYVTIKQALADYHRLINHLKLQYPVLWSATGCSYGGSLAINFAHSYPEDVDAIVSSSAPITWDFQVLPYNEQARINLGDALTERIAEHFENLKPAQAYDEAWQDRELLAILSVVVAQQKELQPVKPVFSLMSRLPTSWFLSLLRLSVGENGRSFATVRIPREISYEQALTDGIGWYTWKYQQCTEAGVFFGGLPLAYTQEELIEDCRQTFGEEPQALKTAWDVAAMVPELTVPHIAVVGGKDPWTSVGIQPGGNYSNLTYIYDVEGFHCPDRVDAVLGQKIVKVLDQLLNDSDRKRNDQAATAQL